MSAYLEAMFQAYELAPPEERASLRKLLIKQAIVTGQVHLIPDDWHVEAA